MEVSNGEPHPVQLHVDPAGECLFLLLYPLLLFLSVPGGRGIREEGRGEGNEGGFIIGSYQLD